MIETLKEKIVLRMKIIHAHTDNKFYLIYRTGVGTKTIVSFLRTLYVKISCSMDSRLNKLGLYCHLTVWSQVKSFNIFDLHCPHLKNKSMHVMDDLKGPSSS